LRGHAAQDFGNIKLVVNNAGMVSAFQQRSPGGYDCVSPPNHLGPFLLTACCWTGSRRAAHHHVASWSRHSITTVYPARASSRLVTRPMPCVVPVMAAIFLALMVGCYDELSSP